MLEGCAGGDGFRLVFVEEAFDVELAESDKAKGEADRFISVYEQYKKAPDVKRTRIFIDTMEKVLGDSAKVIIAGKEGTSVVPYVPLPEFPTVPPTPGAARH